jgi:hypothetical protein
VGRRNVDQEAVEGGGEMMVISVVVPRAVRLDRPFAETIVGVLRETIAAPWAAVPVGIATRHSQTWSGPDGVRVVNRFRGPANERAEHEERDQNQVQVRD